VEISFELLEGACTLERLNVGKRRQRPLMERCNRKAGESSISTVTNRAQRDGGEAEEEELALPRWAGMKASAT